MIKKDLQLKKIPDKPGVYLFKGRRTDAKQKRRTDAKLAHNEILYIGKATSLKDRVRSYFPSTSLRASGSTLLESRGPMLVDMVTKANKVDFIETDSVLEALILEANLIKKNQPPYNTKEKSDKSFCFVVITKEEFPRILIERGKNIDFKKYEVRSMKYENAYGPFTSTKVLHEALRIIRKIFPFLEKKRGVKGTEEFYRQLGLVPDVATKEHRNKETKKQLPRKSASSLRESALPKAEEYKKTIRNIKLFFEGKKGTLLKKLEKEMNDYVKKQAFEKANEIKKQIFALNHIQDIALIKEDPNTNILQNIGIRIEGYDVAHISGKSMVGVMTVIGDGEAEKSEYRKFKIRSYNSSNDPGALKEILERRFGHPEWRAPNLIAVDGGKAQKNAVEHVLRKIDLPIPVVAVTKDDKHRAKNIVGDKKLIRKHESEILLANAEAHRFAIKFHRETERKRLKST